MKHVRVIAPLVLEDEQLKQEYLGSLALFERADLKVSGDFLDRGPLGMIAGPVEEALLVPGLIDKAREAEREGVDALLVDCMADPGVEVVRSCVSIPVFGPGRLSMNMASLLGRRFSILTEDEVISREFEEEVRKYGLQQAFASCRSVDGCDFFEGSPEQMVEKLAAAAEQAVREDGADLLVLGCTRFAIQIEALAQRLSDMQIPAPLINPTQLAINTLASLLDSGLSHSKLAYPYPEGSRFAGLDMPDF